MQSIIISLKNNAKFLILAMAVLTCCIFTTPSHAQASVIRLDGYAWSDNIGWVSMNCRTGGSIGQDICATSNYSVAINPSGTVTGYAWSSNIGWIRFGGLSGFPTTGGTTAVNARVTGTYPNFTFQGWAKACGGDDTNASCNTVVTVPSTGWDGWIALNGTGPNFGITMTAAGATAGSYAWGSTVVGWLNFNNTFSRVIYVPAMATISGTGCTDIPIGSSSCVGSVTWNITNAGNPNIFNSTVGGPNVYNNVASGTSQPITLQAGNNVIQARDGSTSLGSRTLSATCVAGASPIGTICQPIATAAPTVTLTTTKRIARVGDTVGVTWTINPSPLAAGSCTLSGPGISGTVTSGGSQTSSPLRNKTRYTITCTGSFPTVTATADVEIIPTASEV